MIGCDGFTDAISCIQYTNDIMMMKTLFIFLLLILSFVVIYYTRSKHYKKLIKEFSSFKTFFWFPKWSAYLYLGFLFYVPFLLSLNIDFETFMIYIYIFIVPNVAWLSLLSFLLFIDWVFQRLGFNNFKHFINSALKK